MAEIHGILTDLVKDAITLDRHSHELTPVIVLFDITKTAITNAAEQIEAQQRLKNGKHHVVAKKTPTKSKRVVRKPAKKPDHKGIKKAVKRARKR